MKITKYAQSTILIQDNDKRILINPGHFCYNENFSANDWNKVDIFLITHEHRDHCMPEAIKVINRNNPDLKILTTVSVKNILAEEGINSEALNSGEEKQIGSFKIKGIESIHGNLPNGKLKPEVIGFLINGRIYHPGDTIYMKDKPQAEIVFPPICGTVVMNPKEAALFSKEVTAKIAIPVHYDNPDYPVDVGDFVKALGSAAKVLKNGQSLEV